LEISTALVHLHGVRHAHSKGRKAIRVARLSASLGIGLLLIPLACLSGREPTPDPLTRLRSAEQIARESGFRPMALGTPSAYTLPVAAWIRPASHTSGKAILGSRTHIYIEGDGLAWRRRGQVSEDPTPARPVALLLAAADPTTAAVIYFGRPCQYGTSDESPCRPIHWTAGRYGDAVIAAMHRSLDRVIEDLGLHGTIDLIGYSGGGVVAALLAAQRSDIQNLITVAAPPDIALWTRTARVSPLLASNSPMEQLTALRSIRQHHYVGQNDKRVPPAITEAFHLALGPKAPSRFTVVEGIDHGAWPEVWSHQGV
jgi:pimeloyl-ACP methyl ester carboxylesterase